jgi:ketosteroid isomerase-like protein
MNTAIEHLAASKLGKQYEEHIGFIRAKNIDGLLNQYTDDCVLITTLTPDKQPSYVHGRAELAAFFRTRIFSLEEIDITLNQWAETPDTLMIVEEVRATGTDGVTNSMEFYDNWYLRDGKIAIHFAGTIRYPDGIYVDQTRPKADPPDTPLGRMYHEHIGFIKAKNVAGILNQYAEDALLIGTLTEGRRPRYVRGRAELRDFFNGNFMGLQSLESKIDQWAEIENGLMIAESVSVTGVDGSQAAMSFYDNWVLRNGKIAVHFAGVVRYPDGSYA